MATIFVNGVFDLLHEGHKWFLRNALHLGAPWYRDAKARAARRPDGNEVIHAFAVPTHHLIVAINSDESARALKGAKWGEKYPRDSQTVRAMNLREYADQVLIFDTEEQLRDILEFAVPCIICKGPDYAGKRVTGDDLAPVIILDTPEPESVKQMKVEVYGQASADSQPSPPNSGGSRGILSAG